MKNVKAIILAAGQGSRMNTDVPKQFLELNGKPVLSYSMDAFENSSVSEIILVSSRDYIEYCQKEIVEKFNYKKVKSIVEGGNERYMSVKQGLLASKGADYVLIHDSARPCITKELIEASIEMVSSGVDCTLGVPAKDTIKLVDKAGFGIDTPPRRFLWQIQTPQSFDYEKLCEAYEIMERSGDLDITDDTMIMERYLRRKTKVIMGDYTNIKITTKEDLNMAGIFLKNMQKRC